MDKAVLDLLWVCENKPDTFSSLIMWWFDVPYSHCAFIHRKTGMLWHATTPGGVKCEKPEVAMKGCHAAARMTITLNCSDDVLEAFLAGEYGKPYSLRGNIGLLIDRLPKWAGKIVRLITVYFRPGEDAERNCSEFVGNVVNRYHKTLIGPKDKWTPPGLEKFLAPLRCQK